MEFKEQQLVLSNSREERHRVGLSLTRIHKEIAEKSDKLKQVSLSLTDKQGRLAEVDLALRGKTLELQENTRRLSVSETKLDEIKRAREEQTRDAEEKLKEFKRVKAEQVREVEEKLNHLSTVAEQVNANRALASVAEESARKMLNDIESM